MFKKKTDTEKLFTAINWNRIKQINSLVEKIDELTQQGKAGYTPLIFALDELHFDGYINIFASKEKRTATIEKIINKMTDFSSQTEKGNNALMVAIDNAQLSLAEKILNKMDDLNQQNADNDTALMLSLNNGSADISKKIIDKMDDVSQQNKLGQNALMVAIYTLSKTTTTTSRSQDSENIIDSLIEKTTDFNQHSTAGNSALMIAIDLEETEIALKILEKMDNVSQVNKTGYDAMSIAEKRGNFSVINAIKLKQGDYETTLLHLIENGKDAEAKTLVEEKDKKEAKMDFAFAAKDIKKIEALLTGNKPFSSTFNDISDQNAQEIANGLHALAATIEKKITVKTEQNDNQRSPTKPSPALKKQ